MSDPRTLTQPDDPRTPKGWGVIQAPVVYPEFYETRYESFYPSIIDLPGTSLSMEDKPVVVPWREDCSTKQQKK